MDKISHRSQSTFTKDIIQKNKRFGAVIDTQLKKERGLPEISAVRHLSRWIPHQTALFVGSSLPIRELDSYADRTGTRDIQIGANRGASGIDGTIATATGFLTGIGRPTTLLLGDLAFLYDLNSLALCRGLNYPLVIVVLNNNGGGIFQYLPVSQVQPAFEKFFAAGQNISFESAAKLFKLDYSKVKNLTDFKRTYRSAIRKKGTMIIEIQTNREENTRISACIQREAEHV